MVREGKGGSKGSNERKRKRKRKRVIAAAAAAVPIKMTTGDPLVFHLHNLTRVFRMPCCLATCLLCFSHLNVFTY